jgi:hypothetical protein
MESFSLISPAEPLPSDDLIGRDEMNLAEFPLTLLTDVVPDGQNTLHYKDRYGTLTVTGSDAYGLPRAVDADVIVALIQLTKRKNNFADRVVSFTRYELLQILQWKDVGKSYIRLAESLNRWATVSLRYQGTWWDKGKKQKVSVTMHILDSVIVYDRSEDTSQASLPLSTFTWNDTFLKSCQDGNLKSLNLTLYFSLKYPSSKRLYRFLDKRFNARPGKPGHVFPLVELAITRVGLSPNYAKNVAKIKEKLQPAIDELERIRFLSPMHHAERYRKEDGEWKVHFMRFADPTSAPTPEEKTPEPASPPPLVTELVNRGVHAATAAEFVQQHPGDHIERQIEILDWVTEKKPSKIDDPAAYLVAAIKRPGGHSVPKGFVSKTERARQADEKRQTQKQADEERRRERQQKADAEAEREAIDAYIKQLDPAGRRSLETDALAHAGPEAMQNYEDPVMARFRDTLMLGIVREYVRQLLKSREAIRADA